MKRYKGVTTHVSELVDLLRPSFTDEELIHAKQMQRGYTALNDIMAATGRVIVAVHGTPEAVILPYKDIKALWDVVHTLLDRAENRSLAELAVERLSNHRDERLPLEQTLAEMREMINGSPQE